MSLPSHDQGAWNIWAIMMFGFRHPDFAEFSIVFELFLLSRTLLNRPLKKNLVIFLQLW
jgi:hypothetical protein